MNKKINLLLLFLVGLIIKVYAQPVESYLLKGEFGLSRGFAQYFGDINPNSNFNKLGTSMNFFFKKVISKNFSIRFAAEYNFLSYADRYNNADYIEFRARNLSFENNTTSLLAGIEFNFLKFTPGSFNQRITPYMGISVGPLYHEPLARNDDNERFALRPLITERLDINDKKQKYGILTYVVPVSLGVKFNIVKSTNIFFETSYVFTGTDYLDDVSKDYAGIDAFANNTVASYFQDRSVNQIYGVKGKKRGTGNFNDNYLNFRLGVSFNLVESCCPTKDKIRYY